MKPGMTRETTIICLSVVLTVALLTLPFSSVDENGASSKLPLWIGVIGVFALGIGMGFRYLTARKRAQFELSGGEQYRRLAEEYRRLTDLAITAQEHTDLKLGDLSVQLDYLREQVESLQKILKDVE